MVNKPKNQGTAFETWLVNYWQAAPWSEDPNFTLRAYRLAEEGSNDPGDIAIIPPSDIDSPETSWTIEAKARANLNVTQALAKAKAKAKTQNVAVVWKKLTRKGDNQRRSPDGIPVIVCLDLDTFTRLIGGKPDGEILEQGGEDG